MVSFAPKSHFVVTIDLKNLTLAINHINKPLQKARDILYHEVNKLATGFAKVEKHFAGFKQENQQKTLQE